VVSQWFPPSERAFAIGVFNGGSMLGSIIAPPLIMAITHAWGWRMAFIIPSALGLVWLVFWWRSYRTPAEHPRVTEAEARHIAAGAGPAGPSPASLDLLGLRQTWAVMLCRFLVGPVVQFYMFWIPEYMFRVRGLSLKEIGYFLWIPFLFGDIGSVGGGLVSGWLIKRGASVRRARTVTLLFGAILCGSSVAVALAPSAGVAIAAICLVLFGHTFLSANMFASISDLFPSSAVARVTALTGIAGGLSGMIFPAFTGFMVDRFSYHPVFLIASVMPLLGVTALLTVSRGFRRVELGRRLGAETSADSAPTS
jgi:ACS family hexuronate transporter-like MFS transporter